VQVHGSINNRHHRALSVRTPVIGTGATQWKCRLRHPQVQSRLAAVAQQKSPMLYTFAVVMILLWLLGFLSSYTMGGFVHILLLVALVMVLVRLISGRKVLNP